MTRPLPDAPIVVSLAEWTQVAKLVRLAEPYETGVMGQLRLTADGNRRFWYATDSYRVGRFDAGPDPLEYELLVPPRLVLMASQVCRNDGRTELFVVADPDGSPTLRVRGDAGEVSVPHRLGHFPDVEAMVDDFDGRNPDLALTAHRLADALAAVAHRPEPADPEVDPLPVHIGCDDEGVWVGIAWPVEGSSRLRLVAEWSRPTEPKPVYAAQLDDLLRLFDDVVALSFGEWDGDILSLGDGRFLAGLMPRRTRFEQIRVEVERVIRRVFGPDAVERDGDGDYQLKTHGVPVWATLIDGDPVRLQVFATVAMELDSSPELLAELNDINASLAFVKVVAGGDTVTAEADLVAESLDADELFTAFSRVNHVAENTSGLIVSMFGGRDLNRDAERWESYLRTDISAELAPQSRTRLSGADAVDPWPLRGAVQVVTAFNPHNLVRDDAANDAAHRDLGVELVRRGARFCLCDGASRDGDHVERGYLVWNLGLEAVRELAEQFRQESVFELTEDELRLVHVRTGEVTSAPRRG